jgi:hypothetical protein
MNDLISRQDIVWHDYLVPDGNGMYHIEHIAYRSQIDALPSAQVVKHHVPSAQTADISDYCDRLWKIAYERGKKEALQVAIEEFDRCEYTPDGGIDANYAIDFLKRLPSAQHTGRWERVFIAELETSELDIFKCSECKKMHWYESNFCPNCGADMRGENNG